MAVVVTYLLVFALMCGDAPDYAMPLPDSDACAGVASAFRIDAGLLGEDVVVVCADAADLGAVALDARCPELF